MALKTFLGVVLTLSATLLPTTHAAGSAVFRQLDQQNTARLEAAQQARVAEVNAELNTDGTKNFRYLTPATQPYRIKSLPEFPFNIGEMYSGLIPIHESDPSRQLFFLFQPKIGAPVNTLTIWFNGGPGCSSLNGLLTENGEFLWQPGAPKDRNPYAWNTLTNMIWIEMPVGVGYTTGTPTATNELDVAAEVIPFFKNFQKLFSISKYQIYVTGESYAGRYVPYVAAAMLDQNDTTYYDLRGALMHDPCIGSFDYVAEEITTVPFITANNNILNINKTTLAELQSLHQSCGYADYYEKYLTFPPAGVQPQTPAYNAKPAAGVPPYNDACDVFDMALDAVSEVNPCFNIYDIAQNCPTPINPLSYPPPGTLAYFNRPAVKKALHAPANATWVRCKGGVFKGRGGPEGEGDLSPDPIQGVLPQVIEATNRVLIANGAWDMIILTNGTLLSIQNMTWNGQLGFQKAPSTPIVIDIPDAQHGEGPQGTMGVQHQERGLLFAESYQCGHQESLYQPRVTYRHLQWVLGMIDSL